MMFDLWPVYSGERFRASWPSCFFFLFFCFFFFLPKAGDINSLNLRVQSYVCFIRMFPYTHYTTKPGRVAQSVGHLTRKSGVLGSISGLATYFRFSFRFFQEGQLSDESMCTKYWLTA